MNRDDGILFDVYVSMLLNFSRFVILGSSLPFSVVCVVFQHSWLYIVFRMQQFDVNFAVERIERNCMQIKRYV